MRLINTESGTFEEFMGRNIPRYAILSHTWGTSEVSFHNMTSASNSTLKEGFRKIEMTCKLAQEAGIGYAWVDTCCIDKSSSAELTEAINSMYRWYERSEICYVYLSDLSASMDLSDELRSCYWFTRGWTLQELIAPSNVVFYDQDWHRRGDKSTLLQELSVITGINRKILDHSLPLSAVAVAQKMSWAAHRSTTRVEDTAYCLLGIFRINMPLLYGEEEKAFERLQQQIIYTTADLSIFAWELPFPQAAANAGKPLYSGFLAESPLAFQNATSFSKQRASFLRQFSITNCGIETRVQTWSYIVPLTGEKYHLLPVDCVGATNEVLGVRIKKCGPDQFLRENPSELVRVEKLGFLASNPVFQRFLVTDVASTWGGDHWLLDSKDLSQIRGSVLQLETLGPIQTQEVWPHARYDGQEKIFLASGGQQSDSCYITLNVYATMTERGVRLPKEFVFKAVCFVVGWSYSQEHPPQVTLVDYRDNPMIPDVLATLKAGDLDSTQFLRQLKFLGIHKAPEVVFPIPGTKLFARVVWTLSLEDDSDMCAKPFWKLLISSEVCNAESLRLIRFGEWAVNV